MINRSRLIYSAVVFFIVLLGLSSRAFGDHVPHFIAEHAGDALWALTAFLVCGMVFNRTDILWIALGTYLFCVCVEVSQLYQAAWIESIRATKIGSLLLGHGFLWIDLVRYAIGVAVGAGAEFVLGRKPDKNGGYSADGGPGINLTNSLH